MVAVAAGAIWLLRLYFAAHGRGITHAPGQLETPRDLQPLAVAMYHLQYVPLCLCLSKLCNRSLSPAKLHTWRNRMVIILALDILYFLFAGYRLALLWELLIIVWALWLRLIPSFSRRWYAYAVLVLVLVAPVINAQRAALQDLSFSPGENQLSLTRDLLPGEARQLVGLTDERSDTDFVSNAARFTGVAPISAVADGILNRHYPLMWGETLREGLPYIVPRALWPSKPEQLNVDIIIERNFGLRDVDDLTLIETECLANFGIMGLCLCMFAFGFILNRFFCYLIRVAPVSEPRAACLLMALPVVFNVESDITGVLAGLRVIPFVYAALILLSVRGKKHSIGV